MTTIVETSQRDYAECAYLLVLDGLPFMVSDREEICGAGLGSWVGTGFGPRRVIPGLTVREAIKFGTEMGTGKPDTGDKLSFTVTDFDGEWVRFFADQEGKRAGGRLSPKDDPAPTDLVGMFGESIPLHSKWIGVEAIGPAGERGYYGMLPGVSGIGLDHAAYQGEVQSLAPVYVYDSPTHLDGRRAALYRIWKDIDSGYWPDWETQYNSGVSLVWVGSISADCKIKGITWELEAEGPSSYWRVQLGANRPDNWTPVSSKLVLNTTPGQREDMFAVGPFTYQQTHQLNLEYGASSIFTALDVVPATGYASDFRDAINVRIATVAATAGPNINFAVDRNGEAGLTEDGAYTRIDNSLILADTRCAAWSLCCHSRLWRAMGYNPEAQKATDFADEYQIAFRTAEEAGLPGIPGPNYFVGTFWTVPTGFSAPALAHELCDNNGKLRWHRRIAPMDISQLPAAAGFEVSLGIGAPEFFEAQNNRPPVEWTLAAGGGAVDSQAYVAFKGSYAAKAGEDPVTMVQIAQIGFRRDSVVLGADTIGLDDDDHARVVVTKWLDGRHYGLQHAPLTLDWASADLKWCGVNLFGYGLDSGDYAHRLLLRLALSSGTGEWSGFEGDPAVMTPGANHLAALDGLPAYSDSEIASLGCNIPKLLVDAASWAATAALLPEGGITSNLNFCRYAWIGAQDAEELRDAILAQRGWAMGWCKNQWRMWSRFEPLKDEDVECVITAEHIIGDTSTIETADLRPFPPRARFSIDTSHPLVSDAAGERDLVVNVQARDKSSRSRLDNGVDEIDGWGLTPMPLFADDESQPPDWRLIWQRYFATSAAGWYGAAHIMVKVRVLPSIAAQVGCGSLVRMTTPYAATREGVYGVASKLGRIYSIEHDLLDRSAEIEVLLQPGTGVTSRRWAPLAMVVDTVESVEERYSALDRTFYCKADFAGHGEAISDTRAFVEPEGLGIGGAAWALGYQWNGREWQLNFEFQVESVNTTAHTITYADGTFSGVFYDSRYTAIVLAPYDSQPVGSWVRSLYSVVTKSDGTFGAGTQGFPLVV